jgi:hypothetical protein
VTVTVGEHLVRVRTSEAGEPRVGDEAFLASYRTLVSAAAGVLEDDLAMLPAGNAVLRHVHLLFSTDIGSDLPGSGAVKVEHSTT